MNLPLCHDMAERGTFGILFTATLLSSWVAGSTYQWVVEKGLFRKDFLQKENQYNILVGLSALSANLQAIGCFLNAVLLISDSDSNSYGLTTALSINMLLMTHTSLMLVSRKVSLTYPNAEQTWQRLLCINLAMLPVSFIGAAIWATSHLFPEKEGWQQANGIFMPISIGLWGMAEASLSSSFVRQMSHYQWTEVQNKGLAVLAFVALCDLLCILLAILFGDMVAMCLWGLLYSVRIRLEIRVMNSMIEYIQSKRTALMYQGRSHRRLCRCGRKKNQNSLDGGAGVDSGDDADSVSSSGSIFSRMPSMLIHPNDLTQIFHANFFTDVLSTGPISKSFRSLATLAKKSCHRSNKSGVCLNCSKPAPSDEGTSGNFRSGLHHQRSWRSLRNVLSVGDGDCCCCDNEVNEKTVTENTVRDSGGSSFFFATPPPVREIQVGFTTSALDDLEIPRQQDDLARSIDSCNQPDVVEGHAPVKEGASQGNNDTHRASFGAQTSGHVADFSDYILTSDEEQSVCLSDQDEYEGPADWTPHPPPASAPEPQPEPPTPFDGNVAHHIVECGDNVYFDDDDEDDTSSDRDNVGSPFEECDMEGGQAEVLEDISLGLPCSFGRQDSTRTIDEATREQLDQLQELHCL
ncbi:expressed unknown protein [Seminavis robusta]|uniref:Transmembrane protein n=1 Tax=Seminavis robusta TaxID=568900 RepID=A0A9N8E1N1_9STRA|nr:expressed unknown protein [Seminavis robusta]|eukprot:Sro456_g146690.1 n/a (634) ;mRNA; f:41502-43403